MKSGRHRTFRSRLCSRAPLIGTFIKTPSPIVAEVLSYAGLDVLCLDAEHAPFGPLELDRMLAILRARDQPALVRVADHTPTAIRNALDSGATGVVVPHVRNAAEADAIVWAAHFSGASTGGGGTGRGGTGGGGISAGGSDAGGSSAGGSSVGGSSAGGARGYAGSTRAAAFGAIDMPTHLAQSRAEVTVVVQIEDVEALPHARTIAAVDGVDGVFVGRVDLAVGMGKAVTDPAVREAVRDICAQTTAAGKTVGMFVPSLNELPTWRAQGASFFLMRSDQDFLLAGARQLRESWGQVH